MNLSVPPRLVPALAAFAVIVALAACTTPAASPSASASTPAAAASVDIFGEIARTSAGLDEALAKFKAGDAAAAEQIAGDAYLEHFELIEPAIDTKDLALRESIEVLIRENLRDAFKANKPVAEIERIITEAKAALAKAESLLK